MPALLVDPFLAKLSSRMNISLEKIKERVRFGSNPTLVRFWGKEVVVFRDDVLERMRRNSVNIGEGRDIKEGGLKKFVSRRA